MPYEPFYERFGELAWKETRSMRFLKDPQLAGDEFGFLELYCNDENCDCRRVMFNVVSRKSQKTVAVIAYGWESQEFYAKWLRQNDPKIIHEMQGPVLNSASHQSELAPALLEKVDPKHFRTTGLPESKIRPIPKYNKRPRSK